MTFRKYEIKHIYEIDENVVTIKNSIRFVDFP